MVVRWLGLPPVRSKSCEARPAGMASTPSMLLTMEVASSPSRGASSTAVPFTSALSRLEPTTSSGALAALRSR
ncbi:hypothetical protein D3C78_1656700 [compost metagenome]